MRLSLRLLLGITLAAVLSTGSAWAQGRGHGRGAYPNQVWQMGGNNVWGWGNGGWGGNPWDFGNSRPPGWDRGRKTGWGNCDMPPGQAKKYGCGSNSWTFLRNRRDRDWDRDRDWRRDRDGRRDRVWDRDWRRDRRYRR